LQLQRQPKRSEILILGILQEKEQSTFDDSQFPALGGGPRGQGTGLGNGGEHPSSLDGVNLYANLGVHKGMLPSEFNIQVNESLAE